MPSTACPTCSAPVARGSRYCPSCGTALDGGLSGEERRVVTVLFADLVGYTTLAEDLDPERVKRLIEGCFERLVVDIEDFGGRVDKVLGDAIVALFGAPVAHEDDADRAVRAALRMQQTLAQEGRSRAGVTGRLEMRIGINTGEVLVGTLVGTDYTAMGDVVNTAARLQAMAPAGGVLIGQATEALLSMSILREPFGRTAIRGRQRVEQPWLVTRALGRSARPLRADVAFVGRRTERAVLVSVADFVRGGHAALVGLVGETGAGKTRLVEEALSELPGDATVLAMAGAAYGDQNEWTSVANGLAALFGVCTEPAEADVRRAVADQADALLGLEPDAPEVSRFADVVCHLLGIECALDLGEPASAADRLTARIAELLRRLAATRPTVVWFDNLQWAPDTVRDLLAYVVRSAVDLPLLLITAQRPEDGSAWPPVLDRPLLVRLPLTPLEPADARALVSAVLDVEDPAGSDDQTVDVLSERGGGNPLFLVELATSAAGGRSDVALSGSLRAVIAARLDELPPAQRAIVDNAAVLGRGDQVGALERFAQALGQTFRPADLGALNAAGLLEVEGGRWRFRSDVVREVAYQTMTKRTRAQRHAGTASVLRAEHKADIELRAHNSAAAAELVLELGPVRGVPATIVDDAIADLTAATSLALTEGRSSRAAEQAARGLALIAHSGGPQHAAAERELLIMRASAALDQRRFADAERDARRALELALRVGDEIDEGEARRRLGASAQYQGDLQRARVELDRAVEVFRRRDDPLALAEALRARGFAEVFGGSLETARRFLGEAMELYHHTGAVQGHAWAHHHLAWAAFQAGEALVAERELAEARERFEALGDRVGVSWAKGLQAFVEFYLQRFAAAEELALAVEEDASHWGDDWARWMMRCLIADLRLWTGRLAEAEQAASRALVGFRELGDRFGVMQALVPLGRVRAALGKHVEAQRAEEELVSLGRSFGELSLALQAAAGVAVHLGDAERALALTEQAAERQRATGTTLGEVNVLRTLSLLQLGRLEEATAAADGIGAPAGPGAPDDPFGLAVRGLVRTHGGDHTGALADADAVRIHQGATYFDQCLAGVAAVLAAEARQDAPEHGRRLRGLEAIAVETGDRVFLALAAALRAPAGDPVPVPGAWRRVIDVHATNER